VQAETLVGFARENGVQVGLHLGRMMVRAEPGVRIPKRAQELLAELKADVVALLREDPFHDEFHVSPEDEAAFSAWLQECYPDGVPVCPPVLCVECGWTAPGVTVTYHDGRRASVCCGCVAVERRSPTPAGACCAKCETPLTSIRRFDSGGPLCCAECWISNQRLMEVTQ
jgi:hypothetical protein